MERIPPAFKIPSLFLKLYLHTLKNYIYFSKYPCQERMKSCLTWGTIHPVLTFWRLFREDQLSPHSRNDIFPPSHTLAHSHSFDLSLNRGTRDTDFTGASFHQESCPSPPCLPPLFSYNGTVCSSASAPWQTRTVRNTHKSAFLALDVLPFPAAELGKP